MWLCSNPGDQSRHWILPVPDYYGTRGVRCKFTEKVIIDEDKYQNQPYLVKVYKRATSEKLYRDVK